MNRLISVDFHADFGFFRKPDTNDGINLSYNVLHKPALLGILGAIIGLEGYKERGKWPEYYQKLKDLKVGIEPLNHEKGNFQKTVIKYSNTVGYANKGTNYLTEEATLIAPAYRCYLLLDDENEHHQKLYEYLKEGKAEFIPYFGKNEFTAWWDNFKEDYPFPMKEFDFSNEYKLKTLAIKSDALITGIAKTTGRAARKDLSNQYMFFERLPSDFNEELFQYELAEFAYTNAKLEKDYRVARLYAVNDGYNVQLN